MVKTMNEIEQIFEHINNGENFLLSGGAGSGKTYTLVEVLKRIFDKTPLTKVACITYTNVAANEIKERVPFENLYVSTIHSFLWDNIEHYQVNLKEALVELVREKKIIYYKGEELPLNTIDKIRYQDWKELEKGVISHDELLELSEYMIQKYPLLTRILADKYNFIFIDEYQDTFPSVIRFFLEHLQKDLPKCNKKCIIGLFGDSMQSIFDEGIGNVKEYIEKQIIKEVPKKDNRRNPQIVIDLANKIRSDGLQQKKNTNDMNPTGVMKFLYSKKEDITVEDVKRLGKEKGYFDTWDFDNVRETKELYLTHNLIAPKAGFPTLMEIYNKDQILKHRDYIKQKIREKNEEIDENQTFEYYLKEYPISEKSNKWEYINKNNIIFEIVKTYSFKDLNKIQISKDNLVDGKKAKGKDSLNASKRDTLIEHLFDIQECIYLYTSNKHNEFIRKTNFWEIIKGNENKKKTIQLHHVKKLKEVIDHLSITKDKTIGEILDFAHNNNIWKKVDRFNEFVQKNEYYTHIYEKVRNVTYQELINLYLYVEGYTLYSTQHNIKGSEFDNVFIALDNGNWSDYNFKYLFENSIEELENMAETVKNNKNKLKDAKSKINVLKRTQKIFYVCCTRAKKNLVVFYDNPSEKVLKKAEDWFGKDNVKEI